MGDDLDRTKRLLEVLLQGLYITIPVIVLALIWIGARTWHLKQISRDREQMDPEMLKHEMNAIAKERLAKRIKSGGNGEAIKNGPDGDEAQTNSHQETVD
jgi:hypothetical protein